MRIDPSEREIQRAAPRIPRMWQRERTLTVAGARGLISLHKQALARNRRLIALVQSPQWLEALRKEGSDRRVSLGTRKTMAGIGVATWFGSDLMLDRRMGAPPFALTRLTAHELVKALHASGLPPEKMLSVIAFGTLGAVGLAAANQARLMAKDSRRLRSPG